MNLKKINGTAYSFDVIDTCFHGCTYCKTTKKGLPVDISALDRNELFKKAIKKIESTKANKVIFGHVADPFPNTRPFMTKLSLQIIGRFNAAKIVVETMTKGLTPVALSTSIYDQQNHYGISLCSLSEEFREEHEPNAAPVKARIAALNRLATEYKKYTFACLEPYPPEDIVKQDVNEMLEALSFVSEIRLGKWSNYSRDAYYKSHYEQVAKDVAKYCQKNGKIFTLQQKL